MDTKICSSPDCTYKGQPQPIDNFYKNAHSLGGFHSNCKDCKNRHVRARYHSDPEVKAAVLTKTKAYRQSERGKEVMKKSYQKHAQSHPERVKARIAVRGKVVNIKTGNGLPHPTELNCAECGKQAQEYHHHNGYDKEHWLDVIPLCAACHTSVHLKDH